MSHDDIRTLLGLICLLALALVPLKRVEVPKLNLPLFLLTQTMLVGSIVIFRTGNGWHSDIVTALWAIITSTLCTMTILCFIRERTLAYLPLLAPYLLCLGLITALISFGLEIPPPRPGFDIGTYVHIGLSVFTYALITIASIATLAAFIKERALKTKRDGTLVRRLPPVVESERFVTFLLVLAEGLLLFGLMTGSILSYKATGNAFPFDHKTLLALLAFAVIGVLIILQLWIGMRGRLAARFVLIAWILLTLGYPGVKFVTDVLIG